MYRMKVNSLVYLRFHVFYSNDMEISFEAVSLNTSSTIFLQSWKFIENCFVIIFML